MISTLTDGFMPFMRALARGDIKQPRPGFELGFHFQRKNC